MEDIDARISAIERDRQHGGAFLTMEAVNVLSQAASECPPSAKWRPYLLLVASIATEEGLLRPTQVERYMPEGG